MRIDPPEAVGWITRTLEDAGFETWAVGGAIRDALLGTPSVDWDLATRATPKQMQRLFRRTVPVGIEHGTVGILARDGRMYEVTTFRRDVETDGRHAVVAFSETIEEDLARRDFTINSVAWHSERGVFDPFDGVGDLGRRVLRTVGKPEERFREDRLRILRAFRFAGRLDFTIDGPTWAAARAGVAELGQLSVERVQEEVWKNLEGANPSVALRLWEECGALEVLAPEITDRAGAVSAVLPIVARLSRSRPLLRWVAWVRGGGASADLGVASGLRAASDRDARASIAAVQLMTRLRFSKSRIDRAARLIAAGSALPEPDEPEAGRRFLARVGPELLPDLVRLASATAEGSVQREAIARQARGLRRIVRSGVPLRVADLPFGGRELIAMGHRPGPYFGRLLDHLLDRVLADPTLAEPETLAALAELWLAEQEEVSGAGRSDTTVPGSDEDPTPPRGGR